MINVIQLDEAFKIMCEKDHKNKMSHQYKTHFNLRSKIQMWCLHQRILNKWSVERSQKWNDTSLQKTKGFQPYESKICNKSFKVKESLKKCELTHFICSWITNWQESYRMVESDHKEKIPFLCTICGKKHTV